MTSKILNDLIQNVSHENLVRFFQDRSMMFQTNKETLKDYENDQFAQGVKLGDIPFGLIDHIMVCCFHVSRELSERSGKKAQYDLAKKIIRERGADAGIFVFIGENGNFRFSLVYANYMGTRVNYNDFRRYTYFVSPELTNKTFIQRIGEGDFSSLENIKEAFSVEKVTSKFFNEFREIFDRTKDEFEGANKHTVCAWLHSNYDDEEYKEQVNKFIFTFLGRIIFLYFLLRKGWIEDKRDYIRKIVEDKKNTNLYHDFFNPLFFDVFAKEPNQRPPGIKEQYPDTPYLNGGLFEHSDLEQQMAIEGKFILFEDKFIRDIILDFFEAYNFTVDENAPDDKEVSIDPEMLGKVFENTLAEEERNKKGTFYTPREVVHFMVKDALRQFLHNETGIALETLQMLVYGDDAELSYLSANQIRLIDAKLEGIKVLDPAVGSAAFPVEMMQVLIDLRKRLNVRVGRHINEVSLKKQLIKNNLYGVDIDPGAIEIAKLRLWLALIVDYDKTLAEPLPNLDFQFRVGNSLQEKIDDIDIFNQSAAGQIDWINGDSAFEQMKTEMIAIKDRFYRTNDERERHQLKDRFDNLEHQMIQAVLNKYRQQFQEQIDNRNIRGAVKSIKETSQKIDRLEQRIKDGTYKLFKPDFHFSEVFDRIDEKGNRVGGFDIVIGNPPYGVSVDRDIRDWHGLGSRDSYGVFISTSLKRFLKPGGVLEFIISDTWLTIKSHFDLREQVLEKQIHKIVQLHQDCFDATVNACILNVTNRTKENHTLIAADLTNISTRNGIDQLHQLLYSLENHLGESTPIYAIYSYEQDLILNNTNRPIFVGSPKLFTLMCDIEIDSHTKDLDGEAFSIRNININNKLIHLVRFGDIADVKVGLQTGENKMYLFQTPESGKRYRNINDYKEYKVTQNDINMIIEDDKRREKIIEFGIHKSRDEKNFDMDRWFGGRYIVPYDKGGASDTDSGWLPNYYVPTDYFIDWSSWAVHRIKTLTMKQRDGKGSNKICSRFQNVEYFFKEGLTLSYTGQYAPNLRLNSLGVFDVGGSSIFPYLDKYQILGNFVCKITKYLGKNYIDHTVNFQVDENKELPMLVEVKEEVISLVNSIISKQKIEPKYDYLQNEQKEIDKLIYESYGLNQNDIKEVETWYARRYPKLAHLCEIDNKKMG